MAFRIITNRAIATSLRSQACLGTKASMSSSSTAPAPTNKKEKGVGQVKKLRDTQQGLISRIIDGFTSLQHADPSKPKITYDEAKAGHSVEVSTGTEKLMQLAYEHGYMDPYCTLPTSREGKGDSKDNPVVIKSFAPETVLACICEPEQTFHRFMKIYADEPRRCNCGYWVVLKEAPRFWEKIPKEELLQIPFFLDLEEAGLLDDYLAGKVEEVQEKLGVVDALHHH